MLICFDTFKALGERFQTCIRSLQWGSIQPMTNRPKFCVRLPVYSPDPNEQLCEFVHSSTPLLGDAQREELSSCLQNHRAPRIRHDRVLFSLFLAVGLREKCSARERAAQHLIWDCWDGGWSAEARSAGIEVRARDAYVCPNSIYLTG